MKKSELSDLNIKTKLYKYFKLKKKILRKVKK